MYIYVYAYAYAYVNVYVYVCTGLEIATDIVVNVTKISPLETKNSSSVATLATRFLYDLDTNTSKPTMAIA